MERIKILFLAADPVKPKFRLRLDREFREIENEIELDRFDLKTKWAIRAGDLQKALRDYKPDIVHFSGHGSRAGILVEDDSGNGSPVPKKALAELFEMFKGTIRVVFLNACSSKSQLEAFKETIDFTIGMKKPVGDAAAITFAAAFYEGLNYGYPVERAFKMAKNLLSLRRLPDRNNPILFIRSGIDPSKPLMNQNRQVTSVSRNGRVLSKKIPQMPVDKPQACLWIHGWVKRLYDKLPTVELDWTKYFDRDSRVVPSQRIWSHSLLPELQQAKKRFDKRKNGSAIDFRGKLSLTAMLAIGAAFPEVGGYSFRAEQPTRGKTNLWRSDAAPSKRRFKIICEKKEGRGKDILIALSITGNAISEVTALYEQHPETFSAMIYAEPDDGPGDGALRSDRDAVALSVHAKNLIRECKLKYQASQIHLVIYGPAAYCLFLGQRLNALGKVVTYERALNGDYKRSVTLQTG